MIYVSKSNRFDYKTLETYNEKKGKIVAESNLYVGDLQIIFYI